MMSAEELANEISDWLTNIGCALELKEQELLLGRVSAIQKDAHNDAIRAAAEKCEDAGTIFCSVDMSTATIRVKNFKNIKSEILSLIQD